jgi:hypothetical protein
LIFRRNAFVNHALTFKYIKDIHKGNFVYRPRVEIRLSKKENSFKLAMLVDSGADISLIPLEVAEILELELKDKVSSSSASGHFETCASTVNAELIKGNKPYDLGRMDIRVPTKKIHEKNLNSHALLGRSLFFNKFDITFRENTFKIILKKPKKR